MTEPVRNNRLTLLLIAGLPLTMILLATWLWFYVASGKIDLVGLLGTANNGELLSPPLALQDVDLYNSEGKPVTLFAPDNQLWRILIPAPRQCEQSCIKDLYYTRQIHTALGKYHNRIERLYLTRDRELALAFPRDLQGEHPGLKVLYTPDANAETLWQRLSEDQSQAGYFLVDPRGWIMMSYPSDMDGKDVMADMKFLLKNSSG